MNFKRVISAVVLFPLVVVLLVFGNTYIVDLAFCLVALMSMYEYFNAFKTKAQPVKWIGYACCFVIALIHVIPKEFATITIGMAMPTVILMLFLQVIITNMKTNVSDAAITFFGICYIVGFTLFIPLLINSTNGKFLVWYILFAGWGTDLFAFIVGKCIGKHKFSKVSPNKSIEGCIGGTVGAVIAVLIYTYILNAYGNLGVNISYTYIVIVAVILSIIGQIGDFAASSIKRYVEIKDFSDLIPGHGGMLDRIDSIIFVAPFAYFLLILI